MLNIVKFGEFAPVIWGNELLKFFQRLVSKIPPVYQKKDTMGTGMFNQAINEIHRRESFSTPGGHLDQCTRPILGERFVKILDRFNLS